MGRNALYWSVSIFLTVLLTSGGCGRKTMVVPPDMQVPEPITDLHYSFTAKGVQLQWSYPQKTVIGDDLETIRSFEVWRAEIPKETYCEGCPKPFEKLIKIKVRNSEELVGKRFVSYEDVSLRPGYYYVFKVKASRGWLGVSDDSNMIQFEW